MNFGKALRTIRAAKHLSQAQLAKVLELDPSFVSLLERGRREPSLATVRQVAQKLHVPVYLMLLLASDEEDLHGLPKKQAEAMGRELLMVLLKMDKPKGRQR